MSATLALHQMWSLNLAYKVNNIRLDAFLIHHFKSYNTMPTRWNERFRWTKSREEQGYARLVQQKTKYLDYQQSQESWEYNTYQCARIAQREMGQTLPEWIQYISLLQEHRAKSRE